jgi:hypothetical protein
MFKKIEEKDKIYEQLGNLKIELQYMKKNQINI